MTLGPAGEGNNREPFQAAQQVSGETEVLPSNLIM